MAFEARSIFRFLELVFRQLFSKTRWRFFVVLCALFVAWQILDFLPAFFFDKKKFQAQLDNVIDQSRLAVSYQGVDVSLFRGVRIIGVRVSFDKDYSRGRYLLEAPAVYVRKPLTFFSSDDASWLQSARIIIEEGKFGYWITSDGADQEFISQARTLLQVDKLFHVECDSCSFNLSVKDNSYFREDTPVEAFQFTLSHSGKEVKALFHYNSSAIGRGDFASQFDACKTAECSDLEGYWTLKSTQLKLALLNNFQKEFLVTSGLATGSIAFDRKLVEVEKKIRGKTTLVKEGLSHFRMTLENQDFAVKKKKKAWYDAEKFSVDTQMTIRGHSSTGYVKASVDDYDIQADFADLEAESVPAKYIFSITPHKFGKKLLRLPMGRSIRGLTRFSINLSERRGQKYSKTEAFLDLEDASFIAQPDVPPIEIPSLHLALENDKVVGSVEGRVGESDFNAKLSGNLELYPARYEPLRNMFIREHGDGDVQTIFALRGKVACPVAIKSLFWRDLKPFIDAWLTDYWEEVEEGIQYSWLPSYFKRREYFVRFLQYLDFSMPIEIERFDWGPQLSLKGSLYFSPVYGGGGFKLQSSDAKNFTSLMVSYGGADNNGPYMTHEMKLSLDHAYDLLEPWFGKNYFKYFSHLEMTHFNNFMGERSADHYLKSTSVTDLQMSRIRLGSWASEQSLPLQWESLSVRTNRGNGYGAVSSIRAENENTILSGYGDYRLFNRQIETNLKYNVYVK